MKFLTAGESHGKGLFAIIEGMPSNLKLDTDEINRDLKLRQSGYGRGGRQKIESDEIEIFSGVRNLKTLGSPICVGVKNRDYGNWQEILAPEGSDESQKTVTEVRPGHADLTGMIKYAHSDARNVLERASARETAVRVAMGGIFKQYLKALGIEITGYVKKVCGIADTNEYTFDEIRRAKDRPLFMLDDEKELLAMQKVDTVKAEGDTAGGLIEIRIRGLKCGFGSYTGYSQKLDARLCAAMMSVQAIKGVEVGMGFSVADEVGSRVHDEIFYENGYFRKTNRAGGIEGGMSNGEEIVLRAAMKPIPTLMRGLQTVDYNTKETTLSSKERSDVVAICACEIVLEAAVAAELAVVVSERLGGDHIDEVITRYGALANQG